MRRHFLLFWLLGLPLLAAPLAGQEPTPGERVRVTPSSLGARAQAGELLWLDRDSLVLAAQGRRWTIPADMVRRLERSRGRRGHPVTGLAVGAAAGLLAGAILFSPGGNACTGSGNYGERCLYYRAGILAGGVGLGALVGALIRTERWEPVALESLRP
ncbi:MAG: hypothetical protein AB7I33_04155 [Gemmatimonadales bacterium]